MSTEEKRVWVYAAVALAIPVVYFASVLRQLPGADVTRITYIPALLTAIGVAVLANIVASIATAIAAPKEAGLKDERDAGIRRYGQRAEYYVLAVSVAGVFALTLAGAAHFWIANALYLAFVLSALASAIVRIVAYRRGF
ncbi:hypothetical protein [Nonomuraea endophytica]|uniref:DUF2178 domain-containing protein n=1 Tax=Nonomuraea endophytica TaxID=714136 RepID=A0A7W8A523_9ACTN|nr:hypothetical protein [Nonomuraea endophytica]MBB5079174.1 hypothetical protein [Nonomuraea endophytica]